MSRAASSDLEGQRARQVLPSSLRVRQWTFAALRLALLLASLFFIAWVVNYNPVSWDLTKQKLHSLSEQTDSVLASLQEPIMLTAFVQGAKDPSIERVLAAYADRSQRVQYRLVDPEAQPALAAELDVREYGVVIVESAQRVHRPDTINEPAITNAILAVTRGDAVPICWLVGHGERGLDDRDRTGASAARTALEQTNYEARPINLLTAGEVPGDCRVVVIAGPTIDLLSEERAALERYMQQDGRLFAMLESRVEVPVLDALLAAYGVRAHADFVIDTARNGQAFGLGAQVPLVDRYEPHPITQGFRLPTLFNMPRSIGVADATPRNVGVRPLAVTTESSWGETAFDRGATASWDEGVDRRGPLPLMVAVATPIEETPAAYRERKRRGETAPVGSPLLVVSGDADFVSNSFFGWQGNGDLMLNSVSWLAGQEDLIAIRPKQVENRRILLTDDRRLTTFFLLVLLLPAIPAVAGVLVMIKKAR